MSHERIHFLNGLRGILAVIIFIHHFFYLFAPSFIFGGTFEQFSAGEWTAYRIIAYSPLNILYNPGFAINFFFLLSGYVQSHRYFKTNDLVFVQKSFLKRYFRLCLPVLTIVLLVYLFHKLNLFNKSLIPVNALNNDWVKSMLPDSLSFLEVVNFGFTNFFEGNSRYYPVLWTMPIELYSSLMLFIIILVTHGLKNKTSLMVFWLFVQLFVLKAYYSALFSMGVLICLLDTQSLKFKSEFLSAPYKWICLLTGLYFSSYPFAGYENASRASVYVLISFFDDFHHLLPYIAGNTLLFLVILKSQRIKKFLSKKPFMFLGNISFMFYLLHFLILFSFSAWLYNYFSKSLQQVSTVAITGTLSFIFISAFSFLLYKLIDCPVVKTCNVLVKKLFKN